MCGIVYMQSFDGSSVKRPVWEQFDAQRSRGTEGFGLFDGQYVFKAALEKRIKRWFKSPKYDTDMLLFHHRFPTSTVNERKAAHPFDTGDFFGDNRYILVHNGCIRNPEEMREKHEKLGITYQSVLSDGTFNDSEALLWEFALTVEGKQKAVEATGDIAFICIKLENGDPTRLFFGRNYYKPLNMKRDKMGMMLSSEGDGEKIESNMLYNYNYKLKRLTKHRFTLKSYVPYTYTGTANSSYTSSGWSSWEDDDWELWDKRYETGSHNVNNVCAQPTTSGKGTGAATSVWEFYGYVKGGEFHFYEDETYIRTGHDHVVRVYDDMLGTWRNISLPVAKIAGDNSDKPKEKQPLVEIIEEPTEAEIQSEYFQRLSEEQGNYYDAYERLDSEIDMLREAIDVHGLSGMANRKEMNLLKEVRSYFEQDEGFQDYDSVHEFWQGIEYKDEAEREHALVAAALLAAGSVS